MLLRNRSDGDQVVRLERPAGAALSGMFTNLRWNGAEPMTAPPGFGDLFIVEET